MVKLNIYECVSNKINIRIEIYAPENPIHQF